MFILDYFILILNKCLCFRRAINIIEEQFEEICIEEQDILGSSESVTKFLGTVLDDSLRNDIEKEFNNHSTSKARWKAFKKIVQNYRGKVSY